MATFAVIENGIVTNCIDAPNLDTAQEATGLLCVEYSATNVAGIGWKYDGKKFIAPIIDAPVE
jgi:hypothetical protein